MSDEQITPFTYVNAISNHQQMDDLEKFVPFLCNRHFSYFIDSVFHANLLNQYPNLPKRIQFNSLLNTLRKRRRFVKWGKANNVSDVVSIAKYYNVSYNKAVLISRSLTEQQKKEICEVIESTNE